LASNAALRVRGLALLAAAACVSSGDGPKPGGTPARLTTAPPVAFGESTPEAEGMDSRPLVDLAHWIVSHPSVPIFSLLVSRNGKLVFELYTSGLQRDDAHYMMSVTKSFTSSLVGIAIDKHLLTGLEESVVDALPKGLFASEDERARLRPLTIRHVLGMSALDASVPPRDRSPEAVARQRGFLSADNRARFALSMPLLPELGKSFLYTDITPELAVAMIAYSAQETALHFAEDNLFGPLDFKNYEWMHEDPSGIDNGGYGLRVRPIDMQKFGILYLSHGVWQGRQVVSSAWVETSFKPWIHARPDRAWSSWLATEPNYGAYWWTLRYGDGWTARAALGWKGQSILVVPEQALVVTLTGDFEGGGEDDVRDRLFEDFVMPAVLHGRNKTLTPDPLARAELGAALAEAQRGPPRFPAHAEPRMIPGATPKEKHVEALR
jgi:CubicO group peptidase (beta-lactamase class C family)